MLAYRGLRFCRSLVLGPLLALSSCQAEAPLKDEDERMRSEVTAPAPTSLGVTLPTVETGRRWPHWTPMPIVVIDGSTERVVDEPGPLAVALPRALAGITARHKLAQPPGQVGLAMPATATTADVLGALSTLRQLAPSVEVMLAVRTGAGVTDFVDVAGPPSEPSGLDLRIAVAANGTATLSSAQATLPPVPAAGLSRALVDVKKTFPNEAGCRLRADPALTVQELAALLVTVSQAPGGERLFGPRLEP